MGKEAYISMTVVLLKLYCSLYSSILKLCPPLDLKTCSHIPYQKITELQSKYNYLYLHSCA